tara:strand:- start:37 stop:282 length:246 start_codon:yes stop_codon:yes gene_type:complete
MKTLLKQLLAGILPALPFGNGLKIIKDNIAEDGYTPTGQINWPKMIMYIITGIIVLGRLSGIITNEDVATLIYTISNANVR